MKKIVLGLLLLVSLGFSTPINYGIFYGSLKDYMPNTNVTNVFFMHSSATTGIKDGFTKSLNDTIFKLLNGFSDYAKNSCKDDSGYAIDNIHINNQVFGEYNNQLLYVSANVVCIK